MVIDVRNSWKDGRPLEGVTYLPAAPGFCGLWPVRHIESGRVVGFEREPVIAWRIETFERWVDYNANTGLAAAHDLGEHVHPVFYDGLAIDMAAILTPTGLLLCQADGPYETEKDLLNAINGAEDRQRELEGSAL